MSRIEHFNLPDLGEGLTEGEILKWLVAPGDTVELNQPFVEVETAKAAVELPSPHAGVVTELHAEEGATVEVGNPIISFDLDPNGTSSPPAAEAGSKIGETTADGRTAVLVGYGAKESTTKRRPRRRPSAEEPGEQSAAARSSGRPRPSEPTTPPPARDAAPVERPVSVLAKPPVRKLAKDLGVDLRTLTGSGPHGSITRADVEAATAPAASSEPAAATAGVEQRIPIKGVRKLTAENMVSSAFTAPHVTEFLTVDVTRTMKTVRKLKSMAELADVRVSPLLLVAKAALTAIGRHPMVNSTWRDDTAEIVVKPQVNLGIAAATPRGLIVPNIKGAQAMSLRQLAAAMDELVGTARSGKTLPADMAGGSFTITNVGVFGVDTGTPILPPGEAAILAFGAVRKMPWVHKGKVVPRDVTTLGLSFDHRIIDGELGSRFLADVGAFLADPGTSLLAWG